jgi:hypothetical protein
MKTCQQRGQLNPSLICRADSHILLKKAQFSFRDFYPFITMCWLLVETRTFSAQNLQNRNRNGKPCLDRSLSGPTWYKVLWLDSRKDDKEGAVSPLLSPLIGVRPPVFDSKSHCMQLIWSWVPPSLSFLKCTMRVWHIDSHLEWRNDCSACQLLLHNQELQSHAPVGWQVTGGWVSLLYLSSMLQKLDCACSCALAEPWEGSGYALGHQGPQLGVGTINCALFFTIGQM